MRAEPSQFSRIAWIVCLGFLVVWLTVHAFVAHERMLVATRTFATAMVERTLLLGELLETGSGGSAAASGDLLTAFNAPGTRVQLSAEPPLLPEREWNHADELIGPLSAVLTNDAPADFRIAFPMARRENGELPAGPYVLIAIELSDGRWLTSRSTTNVMEWGWRHVAMSWSTLIMVLALAGILWAARRTTRHLPRLALAAERLGMDVEASPVEENGPREVRRVAQAFNGMQERIRDHIEERTTMLAAVSHDLRTYLTRLELRAETIDNADQQAHARRDITEMKQMLDELVQFARADRRPPQPVPLALRALLQSLVDEQVDLGRDAALEPGAKITVHADPVALKRALTNLIENAVRYGERARLALQADAGRAVLTVDDEGPGIPPGERLQVLKPFRRLETSRNRATGGSGLGLAIARSIIIKHRGSLELQEAPGGGLRVRVELPLD